MTAPSFRLFSCSRHFVPLPTFLAVENLAAAVAGRDDLHHPVSAPQFGPVLDQEKSNSLLDGRRPHQLWLHQGRRRMSLYEFFKFKFKFKLVYTKNFSTDLTEPNQTIPACSLQAFLTWKSHKSTNNSSITLANGYTKVIAECLCMNFSIFNLHLIWFILRIS